MAEDATQLVEQGPEWAKSLKKHAALSLPEYMVPDLVVTWSNLPLTAHGKVDTARLKLAAKGVEPARYSAVSNDTEMLLRGIFSEVFSVPSIDSQADFFDLGGSSLSAISVVGRVRELTGRRISVRDIFDLRTVLRLAARLRDLPVLEPVQSAERRDEPSVAVLAPAQKRLWFLNRLGGPSFTYSLPLAFDLRGRLDVESLWRALREVVSQQEALRMTFPDVDGMPTLRILDTVEATSGFSTLSCHATDVEVVQEAFNELPYDATVDPPLRARLLRHGDSHSTLLMVLQHIAFDGLSAGPFFAGLSRAYDAAVRGLDPSLPRPASTYCDYVRRELAELGTLSAPTSRLRELLDYWKDVLRDLPSQIELPTASSRPGVTTSKGRTLDFSIPEETYSAVSALSKDQNVTPFMIIQAAFAAALGAFGAGKDLPLGATAHGRDLHKDQDVVGFFVNTLVLRTDLSGDPTFTSLLGRVRECNLGAYEHQDMPFDLLVEALRPERSLSRHPLVQVLLAYEYEEPRLRLNGVEVAPKRATSNVARFDLVLSVVEARDDEGGPAGLHGHLEYLTDVLADEVASRLLQGFLSMLAQAVSAPGRRLSELDVRTPEDRRDASSWRRSVSTLGAAASVLDQVRRQTDSRPHADAVRAPGRSWSYRDLDRASNRLARHLIDRGIGPSDIVGIALPRCGDVVVALLGVLKAGAAYLPLDLSYPAERIRRMVDDARPACILTLDVPTDGFLAEQSVIAMDDDDVRRRLAAQPDTPVSDSELRRATTPADPIYVIYTSGSTGSPKGVVMPNSAFANLIAWQLATFPSEPGDVTAHFASFSFDAAPQEILAALARGHVLEVPTEDVRSDVATFADWLLSKNVSELYGSASMLEALFAYGVEHNIDFPKLKTVLQGGEALVISESVRAMFERRPGRLLVNLYGPTETHAATSACMRGPLPRNVDRMPIGEPITNVLVYVLDEHLHEVPIGSVGELYVGGQGLSSGYLHNARLTAERFLPDPIIEGSGVVYRTGDLVRYDESGQLHFLGRTDNQVKLRGFRIELDEVALTLMRANGVARAAVVNRTTAGGQEQLVGFVVPMASVDIDLEEIRAFVLETLPSYMVPSLLVPVADIPLDANGKQDQRALRAMALPSGSAEEPADALERTVCQCFADVLQIGRVSPSDNFFELGGHSLLASRLASVIRSRTVASVGVRDVFQAPTPRGLTQRLGGTARARPTLRRAGGEQHRALE